MSESNPRNNDFTTEGVYGFEDGSVLFVTERVAPVYFRDWKHFHKVLESMAEEGVLRFCQDAALRQMFAGKTMGEIGRMCARRSFKREQLQAAMQIGFAALDILEDEETGRKPPLLPLSYKVSPLVNRDF